MVEGKPKNGHTELQSAHAGESTLGVDAASTKEEQERASQFAEGLAQDPFVLALRHVWGLSCHDLPEAEHHRLVAETLELGPISESELTDAQETRKALEAGTHLLANQVRDAIASTTTATASLPARALSKAPSREANILPFRKGSEVGEVGKVGRRIAAGGVVLMIAAAAGFALFLGTSKDALPSGSEASWLHDRATESSFRAPFASGDRGSQTDRIDHIFAARSEDYRDNQFLAWGVK
jgi:hypothetical protein